MAIVQQQLRNSTASAKPGDLEPGQLAFNLADSLGYIGNGSNGKTDIAGVVVTPAPTAGKGWLEFPLKAGDIATLLSGNFVTNPSTLTPPVFPPTNGQVLSWSATANGGTGAYVPVTPGSISVYSLPNNNGGIGTGGPATADLNAGLIAAGEITSSADLNSGDSCIITDSGSADTSTNVPTGSYTWDGSVWLLSPSGGGANLLGDLTNVNISPVAVAGSGQSGVLVRDTTVAAETGTGAYKVTTTIDAGTY